MSAAPTGPLTPSPALPGVAVVFPPGLSVDLTVGAFTISTWFSVLFCGIVLASGYVYYLSFPKDRIGFKIVAGISILISVADTVCNLIWCYEWTVTLWGSIPAAGLIPYGFYGNILAASLSCVVTQNFFAWRLWRISNGNIPLVAIILIGSWMQLFVVMWVFSRWVKAPMFYQLGDVLPTAYMWLVTPIISDFAISASMFYYLRLKTKSAPSQSKLTFNAIISRTVQANVVSLVSQVMTAVLMQDAFGLWFFFNDVTITKIYSFSMLISLNARRSQSAMFGTSEMRSKGETSGREISLNNLSYQRSGHFTRSAGGPPVVHVSENVTVHADDWESEGDKKSHFPQV